MKNTDHPSTSSITPQRKHRKLLKDGSGTEVWPESVESVFVQGLREYWGSPYAAYTQSRGRSRWRNQFLVDYLTKQGIERSKKQVASHIQVLRNMWKGESEFHLVAGGDEIYDNDSPLPVPIKLEDSNGLIPFDWDDRDSNSVSPNFSPADSQSEFPPTPEHQPNLFPAEYSSRYHYGLDLQYSAPAFASPSISPNGDYIQPLPLDSSSFPIHIKPKYPSPSPFSQIPSSAQIPRRAADPATRNLANTPTHSRNKVTSLLLQADGMTPFSINVDALAQSPSQVHPPYTLRIRLFVPTTNDPRTPPSLYGFLGSVALENVWSVTSKCITKVYTNGVCVSEEAGFLNVTHINVGNVNAGLPESPLQRCRWLDASLQVVLTQEIIVDDETLLFLIYDLDRRNGGPMPSATLLGYQKYRATDKGTPTTSSLTPNSAFPHTPLYARQQPQPQFGTSVRYPVM